MQAQPLVTEPSPLAATPEGRVERADAQTVSVGKRAAIALALVALLIAPAVGSLVRWKGLPPNFVFPPVQGLQKAPFNVPVFIALALVALAATVLVAVPRLFGFARSDVAPVAAPVKGRLAPWFWPSLALMVAGWVLMWSQPASLAGLARCAFTPQWWGFILVLDAIVYKRTGGRSLAATRPRTLLALAIVSCGAWYLYEYLNLFLLETWYYPIREPWKHSTYVVAYTLAYSTVTPAVIEWYLLLKTFRGFAGRFERGPAVPGRRAFSWIAIAAGLVLTAVSTIWPNQLFFIIWFGPDLVIAGTLALLGIWSPLAPLARGDWSRVILPAVAAMINGVVWEGWNYFSSPLNPHFWKYDVPYVDCAHIFEMPALGFYGYAPFGVSVWLTWIAFAALLGLRRPIELDGDEGVDREA
ncbi:MAG: hypothetical protein ACXVEF_31870 [Polyangiales bacterium]